jgi:sugar phosphate isomerase/epimerase
MYRALSPGAIGAKVPFEEAVKLAAAHGFQGIDVGMAQVQELGMTRLRRLLESHKVLPANTGMPVNFREDDAKFDEGLAALPEFCRAMSDLGCTRALTWLLPYHQTLPYEANFERLRSRTLRLCEVMEPYGLRYGLEFVGPATMRAGKPYPFIHDIDGLLELIHAVNKPNLGFLLDAYHWYTSGGTLEDLDKLSDPLVVGVHVNDGAAGVACEQQIDNIRAMPGETGVIDIATFMRALDRMAYSGPVIVEPFCQWLRELPPEQAVAETAKSLDKIWEVAGL